MSAEPALAGNEEPESEKEHVSLLSRLGTLLDDAIIMRTAFYGLAIGVGFTLYLDFEEMRRADETAPVVTPRRANPVLPAFVPQIEGENRPQTAAPDITTPIDTLNSKMTIELGSGGVLHMTGFIDVGTSDIFDHEVDGISEYITTVELNSPGGSVFDAVDISRKIRDFGWTTKVADGHLCASSCPILFAGGEKRIAGKKSAIGVHQFFSLGDDTRTPSEAISGTQSTTALITRHLENMEVDPQIWVHALETPPQQLYYFSEAELKKYKLVTKN